MSVDSNERLSHQSKQLQAIIRCATRKTRLRKPLIKCFKTFSVTNHHGLTVSRKMSIGKIE